MIVPVAVRIGREGQDYAYSLDEMNLLHTTIGAVYSLQAIMLDLETGESRTYAFRSVQSSSEPAGYGNIGELSMGRLEVDNKLRALRAGLDRWLGDDVGVNLGRVKAFVRRASPNDVGAVMGTCLGVLDERGDTDIVTLLRELTAQTERMVDALRDQEGR